ncbi:MAG: TonB-dependent receptor [Sphingomonadales bacterium]|nr:MAG: TonB-dependent receptor [Sphingomonadales bacterium]
MLAGAADYPAYYTGTNNSFASPANSFYRSAMDHIEASTGNSDAFRLDAELSFPEDSFFKSVRVGGRYADRDQVARFSTYNWGRLSEQWGNGGPVWLDDPVDNVQGGSGGAPLQGYQQFCFTDFFRGSVSNPLNGQCRPFYSANTTTPSGYLAYVAYANRINREWEPTTTGAGGRVINGGWRSLADRPNAIAGTPFTPGEINPQQEINKAAYIMLRFGNEFGNGMNLSGNVGVRYTTTNRKSQGFVEFPFSPDFPPDPAACVTSINNVVAGTGTSVDPRCALSPAQLTQISSYLNGAIVANNFDLDYDYWLPSLNVKLEVGGGLQFRAAYSKGVAPPSLGLVRNYFPVGVTARPLVGANGAQIPVVVTPVAPGTGAFGSDGVIAPGQVAIQGTFNAGNPELVPTEADSFDITAEWYFSRVGQLTASLFYKELHKVLTNSTVRRTFSNNGQTFEAVVTTPENSQATGKIKGFEIAYQQVFDFLPGPLKGLGLQANYTYVASEGVPQSTLSETDPDVAAGRQPTISGTNFPLQGLSEHQFNITPFIDIGPVSARASYSWRSQYLLTLRDVITPFDPIFQEDYGQLDASITISITDQLKLGIQGVNLTNSVTKTSAAVTDQNGEIRLVPRGWYVNDRRVTGMIRFNF